MKIFALLGAGALAIGTMIAAPASAQYGGHRGYHHGYGYRHGGYHRYAGYHRGPGWRGGYHCRGYHGHPRRCFR